MSEARSRQPLPDDAVSLSALAREACEKHTDIQAAANMLDARLLFLKSKPALMNELSREVWRRGLLTMIYEFRSISNDTMKLSANPNYKPCARGLDVMKAASAVHVRSVLLNFGVHGKSIGEWTGAELPGLAKADRNMARGLTKNARFIEALILKVPADKRVNQAISEADAMKLFKKIFGKSAEIPMDGE